MCHRFLPVLLLAASLMAPWAIAADPPRLRVIVTQRAPVVDRLLQDVERAFAGRASLVVSDLKGTPGAAAPAMDDMAAKLGENDIVLALGAPAARAAASRIHDRPVVCAMTTPGAVASARPKNPRIYFAGGDPGVDSLVKALSAVFRNTDRVAVIAGSGGGSPPPGLERAGIVWRKLRAGDDLIRELDALAPNVDGFVFPREATVLNRRNLDQVVDWLARQGKPAIGYSRFLVTAGFPAALGADDATARKRMISILRALLDGNAVPDESAEGAIWLNRESLLSLGIDPDSLDVVAQFL